MSHRRASQEKFRLQMVRAIVGRPPAGQFVVADNAALQGLAKLLADLEEARAILRANGCGVYGESILDLVNVIVKKAKAP